MATTDGKIVSYGKQVDMLLFVGGPRHGEMELHVTGWFLNAKRTILGDGSVPSVYDQRAKVIMPDHRLYFCWAHESIPKGMRDHFLRETVEELHGPDSVLNWEWAKYGSIGDFLLAVPQEKKETEG